MSQPLITVAVPNYNNEEFIEECLESILLQKFTDFEILIVDDKSTDNSLKIISEYRSKYNNIRVIINEENQGLGKTRNILIENAIGTYICFVDPDDAINRYALQLLYDEFKKNSDLVLVHSPYFLCDENLENWRYSTYPKEIPEGESHMTCPGITPLALFKREVYIKFDSQIKDIKSAEDQDMYFKIEELGKISFVNVPLYYYRRSHKETLGSDVIFGAKQHLKVVDLAIKRRKEKFPNTKYYTNWELKMIKKRYDNLSFIKSLTSGYLWFIIKNLYKQRKAIIADLKFMYHKYKV